MRAELLLNASSVHLAAGVAGTAVDSAVWAYDIADSDDERADAAAAAALGLIDQDLPADAIVWADLALDAVPGHRIALTCRGLGHRTLGRFEMALADLDAAVADVDDIGADLRVARVDDVGADLKVSPAAARVAVVDPSGGADSAGHGVVGDPDDLAARAADSDPAVAADPAGRAAADDPGVDVVAADHAAGAGSAGGGVAADHAACAGSAGAGSAGGGVAAGRLAGAGSGGGGVAADLAVEVENLEVAGRAGVPPRARFARALALNDLGRRSEGYPELSLAVEDGEIGRLALRIRGNWRLADGDVAGAVADFTQAARIGDRRSLARLLEIVEEVPDDPEVLLTHLVALRVGEQVAEAVELSDRLLARTDLTQQVRAKVLVNRGFTEKLDGGWAAAVGWLERAAEAAPDDAEVVTACGRVLSYADRDDDARATLQRAVDLAPGDGRPEICLGDLHSYVGRPAEAVEWYERALGIVPCDPDARFGLAVALTALGRVADGARLATGSAITGHAAAIDWCRRTEVALPSDRMAEAVRTFEARNPFSAERALREAAEVWLSHSEASGDSAARQAATALWYAGLCEADMGEAAAAEATLARVIDLRPGMAVAWKSLGDVLGELGRQREAVSAYDRCAWFDPRNAGAAEGTSEALRRLGLGAEALDAINQAIEIGYPDDPGKQQELYLSRARLNQSLGRWRATAEDLVRLGEGGVFAGAETQEWLRGIDEVLRLVETGDAVGAIDAGGVADGGGAEYRTYGLARDDRDGYGGADWPWRLQFAAELDETVRVKLATALGHTLREAEAHYADLALTLHWSGRFALLRARSDDATNLAPLREPLLAAVTAMHRVWPIVEVVNLAAQGVAIAEDPVEAWSVARQPVPDAGPDFGIRIGFWVPALADAAKFADPVIDAQADAALRAEIAGPGVPDEIQLVMIGPDDQPLPPATVHELGALRRYPHDYGRFADSGAGVVLRRAEELYTGLDRVTADGDVIEVIPVGAPAGPLLRQIEAVSVAPDGGFAMFATNLGRDLYLLDLESGATAALLEGIPKVESTAFLDAGLIVVKTSSWLAVFALTPDGPVVIARDFTSTGPAVVCAEGRIIIVGQVREPELVVYGFAEGALGRLAEVSGPVNCYRVWAVGDRAFAADRSVFEVVGLLPAWERFAQWAATQTGAQEHGGLVVEELDDAPYTGIDDGIEAIRDRAFWCVRGPAGLLLAVREAEAGHEILVGGEGEVVATEPPLRESGFEYDWRPDGRALLVRGKDSATVQEVDVARASAHTVAYSASQACYTATGFAVLREQTLTLYAWQHGSEDEPVELVRYPVAAGASTLGWADGGRVLHLTAQGHTGLYVVGGGALYPIGSFPGQDWFSGWNHEGALYFANRHSGREFRAYRVTGFGSAVVEALGRQPVERLDPSELPALHRIERPVYPGTTDWRYFSDE